MSPASPPPTIRAWGDLSRCIRWSVLSRLMSSGGYSEPQSHTKDARTQPRRDMPARSGSRVLPHVPGTSQAGVVSRTSLTMTWTAKAMRELAGEQNIPVGATVRRDVTTRERLLQELRPASTCCCCLLPAAALPAAPACAAPGWPREFNSSAPSASTISHKARCSTATSPPLSR